MQEPFFQLSGNQEWRFQYADKCIDGIDNSGSPVPNTKVGYSRLGRHDLWLDVVSCKLYVVSLNVVPLSCD